MLLPNERYDKPVLWLLMMAHIAGIVGFKTISWFPLLSPFNLLLCYVLLWFYHEKKTTGFIWFQVVVYLYTWSVECIGVNTGVLFGEYSYGEALGPKILGTPLLIGINWLVLVLAIGPLINRLRLNAALKTVLAALSMALIDVLIEPMAIQYGLWSWGGEVVPFQNYAMWFLVSIPVFWWYYRSSFNANNRLSAWILMLQTIFFILVSL